MITPLRRIFTCGRSYIHERLRQCPEQLRLEARVQQLVQGTGAAPPLVGPLEVGALYIRHGSCRNIP